MGWLDSLRKFIETVAPALAVILWDYEEAKADAATKKKEAAELALKNTQDENAIRGQFVDKSDADVINDIISANATPGQPVSPKSGRGS